MRNKIVKDLNNNWTFKRDSDSVWLDAQVPGCVHTDLLKNKKIKDPFVGLNETELQWIANENWIYKRSFTPDADIFEMEFIILRFQGLDTYASVFLNDNEVLKANNMFHPWEVDVKHLLKNGENELLIEFESPIQKILPKMKHMEYELPADNDQIKKTSPFTRKAPYHYGWDWGPAFATSGIWKTVELFCYDSLYIENIFIEQNDISEESAILDINVFIKSESKHKIGLKISESKSDIDILKSIDIEKGDNHFVRKVEIANPNLWWPNGHGSQHMYEFKIQIKNKDFEDSMTAKIGLRDFKVNLDEDKDGSAFMFIVNGKPIFSKGANWIPADSFTTRLNRNSYKTLLLNAVNANMNTLRVWGGGIYECDDFYELCDELGIIVWQDFMFACTLYPGDDEFLQSVKKEAEYQIKRLRNHSSIGLWCGNNEMAWAWHNWGWHEKYPDHLYTEDYKSLFHDLLPGVCKKLDPNRLYWPSSPGDDEKLPIEGQLYGRGDNHFWGVWHSGEELSSFSDNVGRFMSEFGMQSFPDLKTVGYFCEPKHQDINSDVVKQHQKASLGNDNVMKYILMNFNKPKDFSSFVMLSQIMAGESIKVAVESHRVKMPFCMGSLYWQLNDCWPGASWSSLDYFGNWKALHYYAKNFFTPLLIVITSKDDTLDVSIVNDNNDINNSKLLLELIDFNGKSLNKHKLSVDIISNSSKEVFSCGINSLLENHDKNNVLLRSSIILEGKTLSSNDYFFVKPKELALPRQDYSVNIEKNENNHIIEIESKSFLYRFYMICCNDSGAFSDNYFHMLPGQKRKVIFSPSNENKNNQNSNLEFDFNSLQGLS